MGDPHNRKNLAVNRLRNQLKKKRESLADQFEFKMYIVFHFKEQKKSPALFEVSEVVPVMTNNYEDCILKGVQDKAYSFESSQELLEKDIVQLHAPRWHPLRRVCICFINGLCSKFLSCRDWWLQCRCIECTVRIIACYCKTRLIFIVAAEI